MNENSKKTAEPLSDLKKVIDFAFYTLIPLSLLFIVIGILSNSATIMAITFDCGLGFIIQLFAFTSIRTILKTNILKFPYGTGKLENFSSLLYGSLTIPTALFIIFSSIMRLFSTPVAVSFGIAQIPLIPALARSVFLLKWTSKLKKESESPMILSYYIGSKICTMFNVAVIVGISTGFILVSRGFEEIAFMIDPVLSVLIALYMLYNGIILTVGNFKSMADFPLSEEDQLKIMGVVGQEYENYEDIGNIYTRISGKRRFIEMELYFKKGTCLNEIMKLRKNMEKLLEGRFEDVHFTLIPLCVP